MRKIKYLLSLFVLLFVAGVVVGCVKPTPAPQPGEKEKTPEEKFNEAVDRFDLPSEILSDTQKFEGSFKLIKQLGEGNDVISVKWKSSDEEAIKITENTAKVFNPEYKEGEQVPTGKSCKLTATFTKDNFTKEKHFEGTLKSYLVKEIPLEFLHDITEEDIKNRLAETTNAEKKTKIKVKDVIVVYIGEDRFDIVDSKGENRTPVFVGGSKGQNIPEDLKVGDQIEFSHVLDVYFGVLQLSSSSKTYPVKTLINIKVNATNKSDVVKVDTKETITTQAAITTKFAQGAINFLKRSNEYSKIVQMMAKVVVTKQDDPKYGVELEDPATGVRLLAYYPYMYEELKAYDGKIIEFKAITAVDLRSPDSIKDNNNSKVNGKFSPRIGVIEIIKKDVQETPELRAIWDEQKANHEVYLKNVLGGKYNLLPATPKDEENGEFAWKSEAKHNDVVYEFKYSLYNENETNKDKFKIAKTADAKKLYKGTVKYLKEGVYTILLKVSVNKKDAPAEQAITYITGVEIDSKKVHEVDFNDLYKKENSNLVYENKIVKFQAVLYNDGKGKQNGVFLVKDKDNQNRILEIRNNEKLDEKFVVGNKVTIVATLTSYFGNPQLSNLKLDKCESHGIVEGFVPEVEQITDKMTEEDYKKLDAKINKLVKTTVTITEVLKEDKNGQDVKGKVGNLEIKIRLHKKLIGKLEKDSTYELNGVISVYKEQVQVKINDQKQIIKK